jgi:hypothetical protein
VFHHQAIASQPASAFIKSVIKAAKMEIIECICHQQKIQFAEKRAPRIVSDRRRAQSASSQSARAVDLAERLAFNQRREDKLAAGCAQANYINQREKGSGGDGDGKRPPVDTLLTFVARVALFAARAAPTLYVYVE